MPTHLATLRHTVSSVEVDQARQVGRVAQGFDVVQHLVPGVLLGMRHDMFSVTNSAGNSNDSDTSRGSQNQ